MLLSGVFCRGDPPKAVFLGTERQGKASLAVIVVLCPSFVKEGTFPADRGLDELGKV